MGPPLLEGDFGSRTSCVQEFNDPSWAGLDWSFASRLGVVVLLFLLEGIDKSCIHSQEEEG